MQLAIPLPPSLHLPPSYTHLSFAHYTNSNSFLHLIPSRHVLQHSPSASGYALSAYPPLHPLLSSNLQPLAMSAASGADPTLSTPPPPAVTSRTTSPNGVTRSRDEFDADAGDEGEETSSPHPPKIARRNLEADDIAQAASSAKEGELISGLVSRPTFRTPGTTSEYALTSQQINASKTRSRPIP